MVDRLSQRCGGFLRSLSLKGCEVVEDRAIRCVDYRLYRFLLLMKRTFSKNCHNIERLVLHKCHRLTDNSVEALSQNCPKLLNLDLSSCRSITDKSCDYLA